MLAIQVLRVGQQQVLVPPFERHHRLVHHLSSGPNLEASFHRLHEVVFELGADVLEGHALNQAHHQEGVRSEQRAPKRLVNHHAHQALGGQVVQNGIPKV